MAGNATVLPQSYQMIVGRCHLGHDILVTAQADVHANRSPFFDMAVAAPRRIGIVQHVADQVTVVAAVRTVTGPAVFYRRGEVRVLFLDGVGLVTTEAELIAFLMKQRLIGRLMRRVAVEAAALRKGRMRGLVLLGDRVTGKTDLGGTRLEKIVLVRRMGSMASGAFPLPDRPVDHRLTQLLLLRMAGIAEPGDVPLEQPLVAGEMGVVTGRAVPLHSRVVPDLLLEASTIMAGEAVDGGQNRSTGDGQENGAQQGDPKRTI